MSALIALLITPCLLTACTSDADSEAKDTAGPSDTDTGTTDTGDTGTGDSDTADTNTTETGDSDTSETGDSDTSETGDTSPPDTECGNYPTPASGIVFSCIPAGTFTMGCTAGQTNCGEDESPTFEVTLTHGTWIGITEVTQIQYQAFGDANPTAHPECGDTCPVDSVTWEDAARYANAMSDAQGLGNCYACDDEGCIPTLNPADCEGYRLATEAEWEFAARCGGDLPYAGSATSGDVAWTGLNSDESIHPVAGLAANACGLFDMSGNVWEYVQDYYAPYSSDPATDPDGPTTGTSRVMRGGSYLAPGYNAHISERNEAPLDNANKAVGFRIVRTGAPVQ